MLNESTSLLDIQSLVGQYPQVMERVYGLSLIGQIADVQKANYPALALYALVSRYDVNAARYPLSIISVDKPEEIVVPSDLSSTIKVHYAEGNMFLVESNEKINVGDVVNGITITAVSSSRIGIGHIFKNFSTFKNDIDNISYEQSFTVIKSETFPYYRKIKSNFTREGFYDLMASTQMSESEAQELIIRQISQEIADETDKDMIEYINSIARRRPTLYLSRAVSASQSQPDTITEILTNINLAAADIAAKTRRGMNMKIIVSPNVAGLILSSVQYAATSDDRNEDRNPRYIGNLGMSKIFVDHNAEKDYYTVLYKGDKKGDAAIICSPYQLSMNWHTEYNTGKESLFYFIRESILRNPQDTGIGFGDSDFAITQDVVVDLQNLTTFDALPEDNGVCDFIASFEEQLKP